MNWDSRENEQKPEKDRIGPGAVERPHREPIMLPTTSAVHAASPRPRDEAVSEANCAACSRAMVQPPVLGAVAGATSPAGGALEPPEPSVPTLRAATMMIMIMTSSGQTKRSQRS